MDKMRALLQGCVDNEEYGKGEFGNKLDFLNKYKNKIDGNDLMELEEEIIALITKKEKIWFEKGFSQACQVFKREG